MAPAHRKPPAGRQSGAALLLAMLIVVLVSTVTAGMVWQQTRAVHVEAAERARVQAAWVLGGALDWARLILREDQRNNQQRRQPVDSLDEPWATPLAEARLSSFLAAAANENAEGGPEAFLSGAIVDAQSRYNLRSLLDPAGKELPAETARLQRLCAAVGAPTDTAARIADGLRQAWAPAGRDVDANPPLAPSRLADLAWLGIEPQTLARLSGLVEILPVPTPVNANTAPRDVLIAAIEGLDAGAAERLVQARTRKPFASLEDIVAVLGATPALEATRIGVTTNYFIVSGRLRIEDRVLEEVSLVQRRGNDVVVVRRERQPLAPARPV